MNVLVTGPDGFVGSRVCRELVGRGHRVRGALWLPDLTAESCDPVVVGDIGSQTDWSEALKDIDAVVHLAARVHVMADTANDPLSEYRKVNVEGTVRLAREAAKAGVRRVVFTSSVKVNGEGAVGRPLKESDTPQPEDPYGVSKWEAEQALHEISREADLEVTIVRPPLAYGPGVKANFLRLVNMVNRGVPLPLGSVKNQRSLIGLDNLASVLVRCVEHPSAANETFIVSDGRDLSTPELIRIIARALKKKTRLFPFPSAMLSLAGRALGKQDMVNRLLGSLVVDSTKARRLLDWSPPSTVEEELDRVVEWYRRRI